MNATTKQINFIKKLDPDYDIPSDLDIVDASKLITKLLKKEKETKKETKKVLEEPKPATKKADNNIITDDPKTYIDKAEKIIKKQIEGIKQADIKYVYESHLLKTVVKDAVLSAKYVCYDLTPEMVWAHVMAKAQEYAKGAHSIGISDDNIVFGWAIDRIDEAPAIAKKEAEEKARLEQAKKEAETKAKGKSSSKTKKTVETAKKPVKMQKKIVINKDTGEISLFDFEE